MLDLIRTYSGCPSSALQHLVLKHETLILYPSADAVVILNARTLCLIHVLAFWEVFPGTQHTKDNISCVSVDSGMKVIVASMGCRIAAWSLSGIQNDAWRVHSSLVLPDENSVTTLDCCSGLLAVGSERGLSVYTLILDNDLLTWSQKWMSTVTSPSSARFSPSLMYIATTSLNDHSVRVYSTTSGRQTQHVPHPRSVTDISWRHSRTSNRDDLLLYTVTSDSILRVFLPVLDSPRRLQLHASLDLFSSLPFTIASKHSKSRSGVFWFDREVICDMLTTILKDQPEPEDGRSRGLREIKEEGWDLFLRVLGDGSIVVTAVANIDRRPPTLLRQFTLQHSLPSTLPCPPSHLYLLPTPDRRSITLVTSPPLATYELSPLSFFDAQSQSTGLEFRARGMERVQEEESEIVGFVRTAEGKGLGVLRSTGGEIWRAVKLGSNLVRAGKWAAADLLVVLNCGRSFATYSTSELALTLHSTPPVKLSLPVIESLFSLPTNGQESIVGITTELSIVHVRVQHDPTPSLTLFSHNFLPLPTPPKLILPVDPMAWGSNADWTEKDILLSVSECGELAFWDGSSTPEWRCTGQLKTGRTGFRMARCSSAKKSALIVAGPDGEEFTIWDSKESEFASGLEYCYVSSTEEPINDLDWTSTPDHQSILAVGRAHQVQLLCQQRKTYFDDGPGWSVCWKIEIGAFIPYPISDSIWLTRGSFLVGAGHQMFLYSQPRLSNDEHAESLFEYVGRHNGPLEDYHPQMLLQCLLWEKVELVKEIILNLSRDLEQTRTGKMRSRSDWRSIPVEEYWRKDRSANSIHARPSKRYTFLFNGPEEKNDSEEEGFSRPVVLRLIEALEIQPLPHLTLNEHAHLLVLIQTTLEIDEQRRAIDANGLRYLISMRSFYILNRRASQPSSPASNGVIPIQTGRRERLRYRDMIWAFHSESQDLLLNASIAACKGKMCWSDARALGISIWLNSIDSLRSHLETIARNEYMAGDNRDPTNCALYYFALGKVKLVHSLWRQAAWHKEQAVMLKFLSHDFTEPRWRTAALKNAYALLSRRRFEYAAAFFLLGNSLKDAVNVCIKQLSDFQLAVAIARVVENCNDGPILLGILDKTVLPIAFKDGNRWLGSWAFWLLHRRDLAVRILLTPLRDIADVLDTNIIDIGDSQFDDPSLALLFSQLRSKTLQAAQGTSEISGRAEFHFVLQIARVFCRMGCHVLALDLVRSWSFDRPSTVLHEASEVPDTGHLEMPAPISPSRRPMFPLEPHLRRRSSIMIDMDITTEPPTRRASPERDLPNGHIPIAQDTIKEEEGDLFARKAGLGNLMKSAKKDVQVPEFDMSSFF